MEGQGCKGCCHPQRLVIPCVAQGHTMTSPGAWEQGLAWPCIPPSSQLGHQREELPVLDAQHSRQSLAGSHSCRVRP